MELVVGRIGRPHGIRGEVTVEVRTDSPELRFVPGAQLRTDPAEAGPLTIEAVRWHSGRLLLAFSGVLDRTGAEALRDVRLVIDVSADDRPEDDEEFFDHQLVGLAVRRMDASPVGTVSEVLHLPSQDLLAVRAEDGREILVPFVSQIVPDIDLTAGVIRIDPPPGLIDDAPEE